MNNIRCLLLFVLFLGGGVLIQARDYKYGIMTIEGKIITPAIYDDFDNRGISFGETHLRVEKDGKQGVISPDGKQAGKLYDYVSTSSCPLYEVKRDGYTGFINQKGVEVIPCIYDFYGTTDRINEWYCMSLNGKYGMVDSLNNIIFPFEFSDIEYKYKSNYPTYNIGLKKEGKWALADRNTEILTPFIYDELTLFPKGGGMGSRNQIQYFVSSKGIEVDSLTSYIYDGITDKKHLVAVKYSVENYKKILKLYKHSGELINTYKDARISYFSGDEIAAISTFGQTILIDTLGNVISRLKVTPPQGIPISELVFYNGQAVAQKPEGHGVIDINGNTIVPFIYDNLELLLGGSNESTHYVVKDEKWNETLLIVGKKQFISPAKYKNLFVFDKFFIKGQRPKEGVISTEGKELTEFIYDRVDSANNYLAALKLGEKTGFFNVLTGAKTDIIYDHWTYPHFGKCLIVKKGKHQGVINSECKTILDCIYRGIELTDAGYIIATNSDGKSAIFDTEGKMIRPFGKESLYSFHKNLLIFGKEIN